MSTATQKDASWMTFAPKKLNINEFRKLEASWQPVKELVQRASEVAALLLGKQLDIAACSENNVRRCCQVQELLARLGSAARMDNRAVIQNVRGQLQTMVRDILEFWCQCVRELQKSGQVVDNTKLEEMIKAAVSMIVSQRARHADSSLQLAGRASGASQHAPEGAAKRVVSVSLQESSERFPTCSSLTRVSTSVTH